MALRATLVIAAPWEGKRQHRALGESQVCNFLPGCNFPILEPNKNSFLNHIGCFAFHRQVLPSFVDLPVSKQHLEVVSGLLRFELHV